MAKVRYIGGIEKTLIDVAPLTPNCVSEVDDELSNRLLHNFPTEYELVDDSTQVTKVEPKKVRESKKSKIVETQDIQPNESTEQIAPSTDSQPAE